MKMSGQDQELQNVLFKLGLHYLKKAKNEKDSYAKTGVGLIHKAHKLGSNKALPTLANMYLEGIHPFPKNPREAVNLYERSYDELGNQQSAAEIAKIYANGAKGKKGNKNIKSNKNASIEWSNKDGFSVGKESTEAKCKLTALLSNIQNNESYNIDSLDSDIINEISKIEAEINEQQGIIDSYKLKEDEIKSEIEELKSEHYLLLKDLIIQNHNVLLGVYCGGVDKEKYTPLDQHTDEIESISKELKNLESVKKSIDSATDNPDQKEQQKEPEKQSSKSLFKIIRNIFLDEFIFGKKSFLRKSLANSKPGLFERFLQVIFHKLVPLCRDIENTLALKKIQNLKMDFADATSKLDNKVVEMKDDNPEIFNTKAVLDDSYVIINQLGLFCVEYTYLNINPDFKRARVVHNKHLKQLEKCEKNYEEEVNHENKIKSNNKSKLAKESVIRLLQYKISVLGDLQATIKSETPQGLKIIKTSSENRFNPYLF